MTGDRPVPGIDQARLEAHLAAELPGGLPGPLQVQLLAGGRSNLTYLLTAADRRMVLRRPPLGHVLDTAHDVAREHRVLVGLHPTEVPVPRPLLLAGPEVIGAPFYVMDFADGEVLRERSQLDACAGSRAGELADDLVDVLVRLHAVDPAAAGLADLGRPVGFLERQLRRWAGQVAGSSRHADPAMAALGERLRTTLPTSGPPGLVHGDYRLDNVVVGPAGSGVRAVLDWEMATLGDPLTDLASTLVWWDGFAGLDSPVAAVPGDVPGFPSGDRLVERYAARSGRDLADLDWYVGFAFYKIAAIFEGIAAREAQGLTVGSGFDRLGALVPDLVDRGRAALR